MPVYDVIIVGGGIAGLYMAYKCIQNNMTILVIEKNNTYGGRIQTKYKKGFTHDLQYECGPARISSHHHRTLNLIKHFKLETGAIQPFRKHRHITENGEVILETDKSGIYIQKIIKESKKYSQEYLQSINFSVLCEKILNKNEAQQLQDMFGYDAEFKYCNAFDAIRMFKRDFQEIGTYFSVRDGLSKLIKLLKEETIKIAKNKNLKITFKKNSEISEFNFKKVATLKTKTGESYEGNKIVWAIPKKALQDIKGWTTNQRKLFETVNPISLHRIFCQFPYNSETGQSWLTNVERTTTNDAIRQFIPMGTTKGFAQVSYSNSYYADYWNKLHKEGKTKLQNELVKHLKITFSKMSDIIEKPKYLDSQYWPEGVHMWKEGVNSIETYKQIQNIGKETQNSMYIVGEAYSMHQCWIEGALESVDNVFLNF